MTSQSLLIGMPFYGRHIYQKHSFHYTNLNWLVIVTSGRRRASWWKNLSYRLVDESITNQHMSCFSPGPCQDLFVQRDITRFCRPWQHISEVRRAALSIHHHRNRRRFPLGVSYARCLPVELDFHERNQVQTVLPGWWKYWALRLAVSFLKGKRGQEQRFYAEMGIKTGNKEQVGQKETEEWKDKMMVEKQEVGR